MFLTDIRLRLPRLSDSEHRLGIDDVEHVRVAFSYEYFIVNTNYICHKGYHICSLTYSLAVRNLAPALVKGLFKFSIIQRHSNMLLINKKRAMHLTAC